MKATKAEKAAIMKAFKDAEARVMQKIKARAKTLAKDPKLLKQMEAEIHKELCPTTSITKVSAKSGRLSMQPKKKAC